MTAGATLLLVLVALGALRQIGEAKKARLAQTGADFSRRWDEDGVVKSRLLIRKLRTAEEIKAAFLKGKEPNATDDELVEYFVLQIVPNYLEDLAILESLGAFDPRFVEESLGAIIRAQWRLWKEAANAWADDRKVDPWPNFRRWVGEPPWKP
jgi:hypothetical protein